MLLLKAFLARVVRQGGLIVADHDGGEHRFGEPEDSTAPLRIRLTHPEAARHIARYPQLGAGEAYMRGWLVVEPPHDIRDLVLFVTRNSRREGDRATTAT